MPLDKAIPGHIVFLPPQKDLLLAESSSFGPNSILSDGTCPTMFELIPERLLTYLKHVPKLLDTTVSIRQRTIER